jgi:hypothetical protein
MVFRDTRKGLTKIPFLVEKGVTTIGAKREPGAIRYEFNKFLYLFFTRMIELSNCSYGESSIVT